VAALPEKSRAGRVTPRRGLGFGANGLSAALRALAPFAAFAMIPGALACAFLGLAVHKGVLGLDFREAFWPAGRAVLDGRTPYPPVDAAVLAHGTSFVYPPIVAIVLAPVALLPASLATWLAVLATAAALAGTLWVLGVRDWRCYGAALAAPSVLGCIHTAAMSGLLALGIAIAWRSRREGLVTPLVILAVIAAKLFLWPLLLWLLVVRGLRCALLTALGTVAIVLVPWLLGFPGFTAYPHLLSLLTDVEGGHAYTVRAVALSLGSGAVVAEAFALALGALVLVAAGLQARHAESHLRVLALAILAALLLSPVVWSHYLVVLLPVIALARPRCGWPWVAPVALWIGGGAWDAPTGAQAALGLAVMAAAVAPALMPRGRRPALGDEPGRRPGWSLTPGRA
jgi:hypothetical protein